MTGISPFLFNYGMHPRSPLSIISAEDLVSPPDAAALEFVTQQHAVLERTRRHVLDAQNEGALSFDRSRPKEPPYAPGDLVWLNSAPFNLTKTSTRWLGPFKIVRMLSSLTAELDLPPHWNTHPMWHVSHLRRADKLHASQQYFPVIDPPLQIECVLAHRRLPGRGGPLLLTVKYVDKPLDFEPSKLKLDEANKLGEQVVSEYLHAGTLPEFVLQRSFCWRGKC